MKGKPRVSSLGATTPPICATQNAGPNHGKERRELEGFFFFFEKVRTVSEGKDTWAPNFRVRK